MPHTHNFEGKESGSGHSHGILSNATIQPDGTGFSWDGKTCSAVSGQLLKPDGKEKYYHINSGSDRFIEYTKVTVSGTTEGTNTANTSSVITKFHGSKGTTSNPDNKIYQDLGKVTPLTFTFKNWFRRF